MDLNIGLGFSIIEMTNYYQLNPLEYCVQSPSIMAISCSSAVKQIPHSQNAVRHSDTGAFARLLCRRDDGMQLLTIFRVLCCQLPHSQNTFCNTIEALIFRVFEK
ncbi:hypothetical protein GJAV_G00131170 [Gymnothorax javanicus]|nr:hypothetical protein GJAV_G00131170 [Gymnothorax javanicus]